MTKQSKPTNNLAGTREDTRVKAAEKYLALMNHIDLLYFLKDVGWVAEDAVYKLAWWGLQQEGVRLAQVIDHIDKGERYAN